MELTTLDEVQRDLEARGLPSPLRSQTPSGAQALIWGPELNGAQLWRATGELSGRLPGWHIFSYGVEPSDLEELSEAWAEQGPGVRRTPTLARRRRNRGPRQSAPVSGVPMAVSRFQGSGTAAGRTWRTTTGMLCRRDCVRTGAARVLEPDVLPCIGETRRGRKPTVPAGLRDRWQFM
jgi:hypothetical protein